MHMSNIIKKRGHYAKKKCICPKGEKNEDITNDFFAYVQMQKQKCNTCRNIGKWTYAKKRKCNVLKKRAEWTYAK